VLLFCDGLQLNTPLLGHVLHVESSHPGLLVLVEVEFKFGLLLGVLGGLALVLRGLWLYVGG
jgi:hypothetical protein